MTSQVDAEIRAAIAGVRDGDAEEWQRGAAAATESDEARADAAAREQLRDRLARYDVPASGGLPRIVAISEILATVVQGGALACPAFLIELAIRRALGEDGCVGDVDIAEMVLATTQTAGMLDLRDAMSPPGWSGHYVAAPSE